MVWNYLLTGNCEDFKTLQENKMFSIQITSSATATAVFQLHFWQPFKKEVSKISQEVNEKTNTAYASN